MLGLWKLLSADRHLGSCLFGAPSSHVAIALLHPMLSIRLIQIHYAFLGRKLCNIKTRPSGPGNCFRECSLLRLLGMVRPPI
jgi:hypothetical protein